MSGNPHLYLLTKAIRSSPAFHKAIFLTQRGGGGGHFHRPDPKVPKPYSYTRRYRLEDINTVLYHDFSPEYHMHLHSQFVQDAKQGWALIAIYFFLVIAPMWVLARTLHKMAGSILTPAVRPGKDHEHMAPALIKHLKDNNFDSKDDFLGRRNGADLSMEMKPKIVSKLESHGFKF